MFFVTAGRHLAKVSFDQATLGQVFQPRQMAKEKMTKNLAPTRCVALWGPSVMLAKGRLGHLTFSKNVDQMTPWSNDTSAKCLPALKWHYAL